MSARLKDKYLQEKNSLMASVHDLSNLWSKRED